MAPRNRQQIIPTPKGRVVTGGNLAAGGNYTVTGAVHSIGDIIHQGDCNPLSIRHLTIEGGRVNVVNDPNNFWENYRVDFLDVENFVHLSAGLGQDRLDVDYATQAAARTNPSRPHVDIPVNVLEFGEIPRMIMNRGGIIFNAFELTRTNRGRRHLNNASRANLLYNFGLAPLVGDLIKLASLQDQVQRRIRAMERAESPRGLRRTVSLGGWSANASYSRVMQSNQFFWTDIVNQITVQVVRAHCRWLPEANLHPMSLAERERLAFRAALGLTIDTSTLWEALPWSWLIDWCSNVGQFLSATRNIIPITLSGVHVMRETRSEIRTNGGLNSPIRVVLHTKTRNPSFVAPVARVPFLNTGQVGILASLLATRR